jgi:hypothetical protein
MDQKEIHNRLFELQAREDIRTVLARFARGVDRNDLDLQRSCFHEGATDNHGIFKGLAEEFIVFGAEWLATWVETTLHHNGDALIVLNGNNAAAETPFIGYHRGVMPGQEERVDLIVAGRYLDRLELRDSRWRIIDRVLAFDWTRIDPVKAELSLPPAAIFGKRSKEDASYAILGALAY